MKVNALTRYVLAFAALCLIWQLGASGLGPNILPSPRETFTLFFHAMGTAAFWNDTGTSAWRLLVGLILAAAIAFPIGLFMGYCRKVDTIIAPLVFLTYPVPKIIFLPVLFTFLGLGDAPRILLLALASGYQILIIVRGTSINLDPAYCKAFRSMGGTTLQALRHVYIPAALPGLLTALKVTSGTATAVLFLAESFATRTGLGFRIIDAWGRGDTLEMFVGILGMCALGIALYGLCCLAERVLCPWQAG